MLPSGWYRGRDGVGSEGGTGVLRKPLCVQKQHPPARPRFRIIVTRTWLRRKRGPRCFHASTHDSSGSIQRGGKEPACLGAAPHKGSGLKLFFPSPKREPKPHAQHPCTSLRASLPSQATKNRGQSKFFELQFLRAFLCLLLTHGYCWRASSRPPRSPSGKGSSSKY